MADVTIFGTGESNSYVRGSQAGPVWTTDDIGYFFMVDTSDDLLAYKTTNGGSSWSSLTTVKTGVVADYAVWFDKWTPGNTGTKIHIVYIDIPDTSSIDFYYKALDTSGDSLGSEITLNAFTATGTATWSNCRSAIADSGAVSITKAQGGNIYAAIKTHVEDAGGDTEVEAFYRSTDSGASFGSRTSPFESVGADSILLFPGNTSDNQDIGGAYWDASAGAISLKMYDDSANSWTETAIGTLTTTGLVWNNSAAIRVSDKHVFLAFVNGGDASTTDIKFYELTVDSIASPTVTARTDVVSNTAEMQDCSVFIDQTTDDVYVAYLLGTAWTATVHAHYKKSTDDGANWGSAVQIDEDAEDDHRHICVGHGTPGDASGRFYACWFNDDLNDWMGGFTNSVEILGVTAAITGTITSSATESDIVTGGKTIIITLTGDTWVVAAGSAFDNQRDEIISGLDSAQSEANGWDAVVKAGQGVAGVVRTSDTVVTITLDAFASYDITATETITVTVPSTAVAGGVAIVATPTFTVSAVAAGGVRHLALLGVGT